MKVELLPQLFTGGTAYELCERVIECILEEPRRVNMQILCRADLDTLIPERQEYFCPTGAPRCGVAGCFAGWIGVLTNPGFRKAGENVEGYINDHTGISFPNIDEITRILGISSADRLLDRPAVIPAVPSEQISNCRCRLCTRKVGDLMQIDVFDQGMEGDIAGMPGTQEYADSVVARIRAFMLKNEYKLKAKQVMMAE